MCGRVDVLLMENAALSPGERGRAGVTKGIIALARARTVSVLHAGDPIISHQRAGVETGRLKSHVNLQEKKHRNSLDDGKEFRRCGTHPVTASEP